MERELKTTIRDEFDAWRENLPEDQREHVTFSKIDGYLHMVFVTVDSHDFDTSQVSHLEKTLHDRDPRLRVGIEDHRPYEGG